jgi:mannose-6-phosphate isomerase
MTIALTPFTGFCGFRPLKEISHFLSTVPELSNLLGSSAQSFQTSFSKSPSEGKEALKQLFTTLMNSKEDDIAAQAELLIDRAKNDGSFGDDGELAKLLVQLDLQFPKDVGLFCAFFLNYVKLIPGEAMFLRARDVHAYISGGIPLFYAFSISGSMLDRGNSRCRRMYGCER